MTGLPPKGEDDRVVIARGLAKMKFDRAAETGEPVELSQAQAIEAARMVGLDLNDPDVAAFFGIEEPDGEDT